MKHNTTFYARYIKRILDIILSLLTLIVLSPVFILLILLGTIFMKGNPFFVQKRPGKDEWIFSLIKFRTMANLYDASGELLPDEQRLTRYGKFLRSTSLDELPELINILCGTLSIVGPRPLSVKYLPYYTDAERVRHSVTPGLTGLAQANGRNSLRWEEKFEYDIEYVYSVTLKNDIMIILKTIKTVLMREDIGSRGNGVLVDFDVYRKNQWEGINVH